MSIRNIILKKNLLPKEPYIYPMSAIRDEEIFASMMQKYIGMVSSIIETGTYMGASSVFLSQYAKVVHTFDIKDFEEKYRIWDFFNIGNIRFHYIKSDEEKKVIVKHISNVDFCFIDGRHHGGVNIDFSILKPYCKKFLFHDYCPSKAKLNGKGLYDYVFTFIESIKKDAKIVDIKEPFIYLGFD